MASRPPILRLLFLAGAILFAVFGAWQSASAHARLKSADPLSGSALATFPASLTLEFSEPIVPASIVLNVEDESGAPAPIGEPRLAHGDRIVAAEVLQPPGRTGLFQVRWSVRSATDGHDSSGLIAFTVGTGRAPVELNLESTERDSWWLIGVRTLWLLGLSLIAARIVSRAGIGSALPLWAIALAGCASVACALASIRPWDDPDWQGDAVRLTFAAGIAGAIAAVLVLPDRVLAAPGSIACWLGSIALSTAAGHASGTARPAMATALATVHSALALLWIAALVALLVELTRRSDGAAIASFSRWATLGLPLLTLAGVATATLQFPGTQTLTASGYGRTLLVKAAVALLVLAIAITNRWFVLPTLARTQSDGGIDRQALGVFAGEASLLAIVVALAATLSSTSPPGDQAIVHVASPVRTISDSGLAGDLRVEIGATITGTIDDAVKISISGPGGRIDQIQRVIVSTRYVDPGTGETRAGERFDASALADAPGVFVFDARRLSRLALWTIAVTARRSGVADQSVTFDIDTTTWTAQPPRIVERSWNLPIVPPGGWALLILAIAVPAAGLALIRRHGQLSPVSGAILIAALAMIGAGFTIQAWQRTAIQTDGHELDSSGPADVIAARGTWDSLCLACHGASGLDQTSPGHTHGSGTDLKDPRTSTLSDGDMYWLISNGVANSDMPAYDVALTDQQRWDLVAWIREQQRSP
jgi:copper transport protein